jgi:hypothetical protein
MPTERTPHPPITFPSAPVISQNIHTPPIHQAATHGVIQ